MVDLNSCIEVLKACTAWFCAQHHTTTSRQSFYRVRHSLWLPNCRDAGSWPLCIVVRPLQRPGKRATRHPQSSWTGRVYPPRQRRTAAIPDCHNRSGPARLRTSHWKPRRHRGEPDTWEEEGGGGEWEGGGGRGARRGRRRGQGGKDLHAWLLF